MSFFLILVLSACLFLAPASAAGAFEDRPAGTPSLPLHRADEAKFEKLPSVLFSEFLGAVEQAGNRWKGAGGGPSGIDPQTLLVSRLTGLETGRAMKFEDLPPLLVSALTGIDPGQALNNPDFSSLMISGLTGINPAETRFFYTREETRVRDFLGKFLEGGENAHFSRLEKNWDNLLRSWRGDSFLVGFRAGISPLENQWESIHRAWQTENLLSLVTGGLSGDYRRWQGTLATLRRGWRPENLLASAINGQQELDRPAWLNPARTCHYDAFVGHYLPDLARSNRTHMVRIPWEQISGSLELDRRLADEFNRTFSGLEAALPVIPDENAGRVFLAAVILDSLLGSRLNGETGTSTDQANRALLPLSRIQPVPFLSGNQGTLYNGVTGLMDNTESALDSLLGRADSLAFENALTRTIFKLAGRLESSLASLADGNGKAAGLAEAPDLYLGVIVQEASDILCRVSGLDSLVGGRLQPRLSWSPEGNELVALGLNAPEALNGLLGPLNGSINVGGARDNKQNVRVYTAGLGVKGETWNMDYVFVYRTVTENESSTSSNQHLLGLTWHL